MPQTKHCNRCDSDLPITAFNRRARSHDGLQTNCRGCMRERVTSHARANALRNADLDPHAGPPKSCGVCGVEKPAAAFALARQSKSGLAWACRDCVATRRDRRRVRANNAAYYKANRDALMAAQREWYRANKERAKEWAHRRRAAMRQPVSPVSAEKIRARFAFWGNRCWMCGATTDLAVDHVKPLAKGGPHLASNLRPACGSCNRHKSAKWPLSEVLNG